MRIAWNAGFPRHQNHAAHRRQTAAVTTRWIRGHPQNRYGAAESCCRLRPFAYHDLHGGLDSNLDPRPGSAPALPPLGARRLSLMLRDARDMQELQRLFFQNRDHMDHIHLAALMGKLAKLSPQAMQVVSGRGRQGGAPASTFKPRRGGNMREALLVEEPLSSFLPQVLLKAQAQGEQMDPRQSSNVMWAVAKLVESQPSLSPSRWEGTQHAQTCMESMIRRMQGKLSAASLQDVSQALYAVAICRHWLPNALSQNDMAQLLVCLQQLLPSCTKPQDLSMCIYSLACLDHTPGEQWLQDFQNCSVQLLNKFSGQGLAQTIWALVKFGHRPSPEWCTTFLSVVHPKMLNLSNGDLAIVARSLVDMGVHPGRQWAQSLEIQISARLLTLSSQDLAFSLSALAALGHRPRTKLISNLSMRLVMTQPCTRRPASTRMQFGSVVSRRTSTEQGSGQGGYDGQQLAGAQTPTISAIDTLTSQSTHMVLRALAQMKVVPSQAVMTVLLTSVSSQLDQRSTPQDMMLLLHVLATLNYHPPTRFMLRFLQHSRAHLHEFSPKQLAGVFYALGRLNLRPERRWMEAALSKAQDSFLEFGPLEVANTVWALARIGYIPTEPWKMKLFARITTLLPLFSSSEMAMVLKALARAKFSPPAEWLHAIQNELSVRILPPASSELASSATSCLPSSRRFFPLAHGLPLLQSTQASSSLVVEAQHGRRRSIDGPELYASLRALSVLYAEKRSSWVCHPRTPGIPVSHLLVKTNVPPMQWLGDVTTATHVADAACLASLMRLRRRKETLGALKSRRRV